MGKAGLDGPEAAHRPTRWVVGPYNSTVDVGTGHPVGTSGKAGCVCDYGAARRGVGTAIEDQAGLDPDNGAVTVGVVPKPHPCRVPVHVTVEGLLA